MVAGADPVFSTLETLEEKFAEEINDRVEKANQMCYRFLILLWVKSI